MRYLVLLFALGLLTGAGAEVVWKRSDALGQDRGPAPQAGPGEGWVLRVEALDQGESRTLFEDGNEDSLRLIDFDSAGRIVRVRDHRHGQAIWEVSYEAATGLPISETLFLDNQPAEVSSLQFSERILVGRLVKNPAGEELYRDRLWHWPDGSLRRLERDGPSGPLAEASWRYGSSGALVGAWLANEDERSQNQHREWIYSPGRTEERLVGEAAILVTRITEALAAGSRETRTEVARDRQETRSRDAKGRVVEEVVKEKGVVLQTRRWTYDAQGRLLRTEAESGGPLEAWDYAYHPEGFVDAALTRDGVLVREERSHGGEKQWVRWYDRGALFLEESWSAGKRVKETYYQDGQVVRERVP